MSGAYPWSMGGALQSYVNNLADNRSLALDRKRVGKATVNQGAWTGATNMEPRARDQAQALREPGVMDQFSAGDQGALRSGYATGGFQGIMGAMGGVLAGNKATAGMDWYDIPDYTRTAILSAARE